MSPKKYSSRFLLLFLIQLSAFALPGQEPEGEERMRGISRANAPAPAYVAGKNHMFVIGIDEYENWLALRNAASDARGMEEIFAEQFGFSPIMPALYNKEATKENIMNSLDQIRTKVQPEDNLVLFFAGHGETRVDTVGNLTHESGYLIPVEGGSVTDENWSSYIEVEAFLKQVALMPTRHVTVILDACHSGIAIGGAISGTRGSEKAPIASLAVPPSRRVITSARKDQLASDDGPLPKHSLFTGMLIKGLRNGAADADQDGRVTTSELGTYMARSVREESRDRQTPDFGAFVLDERGEMVLELEASTPTILLANANSQLAAGKTTEFIETMGRIKEMENLPKSAYYLFYRAALILNQIDRAEQAMQIRLDMENESELVDGSLEQLAYRDLKRIQTFINFWQPYFEGLSPSEEIKVELIHQDTVVAQLNGSPAHGRFALPTNAEFQIRITNVSNIPIFPYTLYFDEFGRGGTENLWEDIKIYQQGLQPGESVQSYTMVHSGSQGLKEFRLLFSGRPMLDFFKPTELMDEDYKLKPNDDLTGYSMRLVFDRASRTY